MAAKRDPKKDGDGDEQWDGPLATDGRKPFAKKVVVAKKHAATSYGKLTKETRSTPTGKRKPVVRGKQKPSQES